VKKILFFIFLVALLPSIIVGQQKTDNIKKEDAISFGFNLGPLVPIYGKSRSNDDDSRVSLKSFNYMYKGAFSAGCYVNVKPDSIKNFSFQPEISYCFFSEYYSYASVGRYLACDITKTSRFNLSHSEIVISILPEFYKGNKIKFSYGLGVYTSIPVYTKLSGQMLINYTGMTWGNDTLKDNEIKKNIDIKQTLGWFLNLGIEIPCKEKKLVIAFKAYRGTNNFFIPRKKQYLLSLCVLCPINYR
jgi:hypothetical protein